MPGGGGGKPSPHTLAVCLRQQAVHPVGPVPHPGGGRQLARVALAISCPPNAARQVGSLVPQLPNFGGHSPAAAGGRGGEGCGGGCTAGPGAAGYGPRGIVARGLHEWSEPGG